MHCSSRCTRCGQIPTPSARRGPRCSCPSIPAGSALRAPPRCKCTSSRPRIRLGVTHLPQAYHAHVWSNWVTHHALVMATTAARRQLPIVLPKFSSVRFFGFFSELRTKLREKLENWTGSELNCKRTSSCSSVQFSSQFGLVNWLVIYLFLHWKWHLQNPNYQSEYTQLLYEWQLQLQHQ